MDEEKKPLEKSMWHARDVEWTVPAGSNSVLLDAATSFLNREQPNIARAEAVLQYETEHRTTPSVEADITSSVVEDEHPWSDLFPIEAFSQF